jgi:hypothetical protein
MDREELTTSVASTIVDGAKVLNAARHPVWQTEQSLSPVENFNLDNDC